nr:formate/nitrite transporter family protein [Desulfurobacterium thermolithotrophum]
MGILSPAEVVRSLSDMSKHKAETSWFSIIILSMMAGGAIALGDIFWAHSVVQVGEKLAPGIANFIGGFAFSVGLMLVVFFGGHLFTSSTLTTVTVLEKKLDTFRGIISYWTVVWIFNFVGAVLMAFMYFYSGLPLKFNGWIAQHFVEVGAAKCSLSF